MKDVIMNSKERKVFWDALGSIRDNTPEHVQALLSTITTPDSLCRFRSVNEHTLTQLQGNTLYYSSADYYDDPFDTFIHVDFDWINGQYTNIHKALSSDTTASLSWLTALEQITGVSGKQFLNNLKEYPMDLSAFPQRIKQIRTVIQKKLFSICFCEDTLNETLWLKYANNYKGFALVYDVKNPDTFCAEKKIFARTAAP